MENNLNNIKIEEKCNTINNTMNLNYNIEDDIQYSEHNSNVDQSINDNYINNQKSNQNTMNINNIVNNNNPETEVVIYKIQNDYQTTVCKIIEKSYKINKKCLLLCNNTEEIEFFNSKLWTYSKLSFIPHGSKYSMNTNDAIYCNTWISDNLVYVNNPNYLVVIGTALPNNIQYNFEKIIFISYNTDDYLDLIKNKYKNCTIWIQSNNGWVKDNNDIYI